MPTNKHAVIRYQTLDRCFRNPGRLYDINALIDACSITLGEHGEVKDGISKRQIFVDIKFMESTVGWNINLKRMRDGRKIYYRYSDTAFSINSQHLNETEENQLREALSTLSRFKGLPQFEWIDEITARLNSALHLSHTDKKIIEFDQNNYLKGLEYITPLYNAIVYEKVINIQYKSFKQDATQHFVIHPYFLKQYNNRWYIFGKNDTSDRIINLALDRMLSISDFNEKYISNTSMDFNEYFEDIVGVTVNDETPIEKIVLKIDNSLYPYIETKPLHGSQKVKEKGKEHTLITLDLIPNYELESLILSYGEGVQVISPESLKNKIKQRLELTNNNYFN